MSSLRATRLNVLDTRNLAAYEAGDRIYPGAPDLSRKALENSASIEARVREVLGGTLREGEFVSVPLEHLLTLLPELPFNDDLANMWDPDLLSKVLRRTSERYGDRGFVFFRQMTRTKPTLPTGALSGDELEAARATWSGAMCISG